MIDCPCSPLCTPSTVVLHYLQGGNHEAGYPFQFAAGLESAARDMGVNPTLVLRLAGLPADLFARKDASLSPADYFCLWHGLEQAAGIDVWPLKMGQVLSVEAFDPTIFASLCSANLNTALQRLSQFKNLVGPLTFTIEITAHQTYVTLDCYRNSEPIPRSLGVAELVFLTQLARLGTRKRIVPSLVELVQPPSETGLSKKRPIWILRPA